MRGGRPAEGLDCRKAKFLWQVGPFMEISTLLLAADAGPSHLGGLRVGAVVCSSCCLRVGAHPCLLLDLSVVYSRPDISKMLQ